MDYLLGYMTFYFKVESDTQIAYAKINNDFRKLPTDDIIETIKQGIEGVYKEIGMNVTCVTFCSEKEYEENRSDDVVIDHEWNDEVGIPKSKNNEVITNADKIRNMSDEELSNVITSGEIAAICPECAFYGTSDLYVNENAEYSQKNCSTGILKWLKQEAR